MRGKENGGKGDNALREVLDEEIGLLNLERLARVRGAGGDDNSARGPAGADSSGGVLEDDACCERQVRNRSAAFER